jgi:hypothetical protein
MGSGSTQADGRDFVRFPSSAGLNNRYLVVLTGSLGADVSLPYVGEHVRDGAGRRITVSATPGLCHAQHVACPERDSPVLSANLPLDYGARIQHDPGRAPRQPAVLAGRRGKLPAVSAREPRLTQDPVLANIAEPAPVTARASRVSH